MPKPETAYNTRLATQLRTAGEAIASALRVVEAGSVDNRRRIHRVDLALQRAEERMGDELPRHGTRGGSSSPGTMEENAERRSVVRQAAVDASDLPRLCRDLEQAAQRLDRLVNRQVEVVHESKLPADGVLPGCRSCARIDAFSAVDEKCPTKAMCRWCREFENAYGILPPAEILEVFHRQSPAAAGRAVARSRELQVKAAEVDERKKLAALAAAPILNCGTSWTHLGEKLACEFGADHEGPHSWESAAA